MAEQTITGLRPVAVVLCQVVAPGSSPSMVMRQVMLPEQVLAVVVPVWSPHYCMNMLASRLFRIGRKAGQVCGRLVIEFYQHHRAVDAVIEHSALRRLADPRKPRAVQVLA